MVTDKHVKSQKVPTKELGKISIFIEVANGHNTNLSKLISDDIRQYLLKLNDIVDVALIKKETSIEATKDGTKETCKYYYSLYIAPNKE